MCNNVSITVGEWVSLTPLALFLAGTTYVSYRAFCPVAGGRGKSTQSGEGGTKVNLNVKKDSPKVVDSFDIEDIGQKKVYCRCWRSKKVTT